MGKNRPDCAIECVEPLKRLLEDKSQEICAIIIEPMVLGSSGIIVYPKEYLTKAAQLAKKFNVHLILDEVATGFGRTGKMFAFEWAGVKPDFVCLSKGITAGYLPLAATLTTDKIYRAFYADYSELKTFYHGHTYTANPISCAAALASLKIFKDEDTLQKINEVVPFLHQRVEEFRGLKLVGDVRYIGLIAGLELVKDKKTKREFSFQERIGFEVFRRGLKHNIILRPLGNVIYLFLPLCIKKREIDEVVKRAYSVINSF
jgi:adenosylmethionine-8-amino-7-oxononanoate aminotransferase